MHLAQRDIKANEIRGIHLLCEYKNIPPLRVPVEEDIKLIRRDDMALLKSALSNVIMRLKPFAR